jgi:uncharacterized protein
MYFFCKLIAPRPSFVRDMTAAEGKLMQDHAAYWRDWMDRGHIEAFGMVGDPEGPYGVGILDFEDADAARRFADADPTILADAGFRIEIQPMPFGAVLRERR